MPQAAPTSLTSCPVRRIRPAHAWTRLQSNTGSRVNRPKKQLRVHPRNQQVVANHPEMRDRHRRDIRPGRDVDETTSAPARANQDFDVELHAVSDAAFVQQRDHALQRIDTKATHRVFDLKRQRVDPHPDVRQISRRFAYPGRALAILRRADDEVVGVRARGRQKSFDVGQVVLAVGIDLQRMRKTTRPPRASGRVSPRRLCRSCDPSAAT